MRCKFNETRQCPKADLFENWKDDKRETGFLSLGLCPKCPIYNEDIADDEVREGHAEVKP